jgi:L-fuculose-phosphate aldolase
MTPAPHPGAGEDEAGLRAEIVRIGRLMHARDLVDGTAGNISARLGPDHLLATPSGLPKGFLEPDDLIVVDNEGRLAGGRPGLKPTSELAMHLEAYRRRPDIRGVVHAHPITTVALSIAGVSLAECVIPEAIVFLGLVPTMPYATPSSDENRQAIAGVIGDHDAIVLQYHGTLTVGGTVTEAYQRLETLEHTAKIVALSRLLGGGPPLPPEQVSKLLAARQALGLDRPGDNEAFCVACGVCHAAGEHQAPSEGSAAGERRAWDDQAVDEEERLVRRIAERVREALRLAAD